MLCLVLSAAINGSAQTYDADALRFSLTDYGSTARSLGVGGAFGSVGGDFSSLSINPAGLGIYRKSEISASPYLSSVISESRFHQNNLSENRFDLDFSQLGLVFSKVKKNKQGYATGIVSNSFAIGINQLADFSQKQFFSGENSAKSITQSYVDELNQNTGQDVNYDNFSFESVLAYDGWLANFQDSMGYYTTPVNGTVLQEGTVELQGGMNEVVIALATNLSNKLYVGGSLNIPLINYERTFSFSESDQNDAIDIFESMSLNQEYTAEGWGLNAKLGVIYKPARWLKVGAAIHTPTRMHLDEEFSTQLSSEFDTISYDLQSPLGVFDYKLRLPWRATAGASAYFNKYGFFSVDYEFVNYSSMNYDFGSGNGDFENNVNELLEAKYGQSHNLRLGLEFAINIFRLRGGFGMMAKPFDTGVEAGDFDLARQTYSAGVGLRKQNFFLDLSYRRTRQDEYLAPYFLNGGGEPGVETETRRDDYKLTFGWRFGKT